MEGIGSVIGIAGAALFIVGLCWLRYVALSIADFACGGLCLAGGVWQEVVSADG
jgi:hypothetical protein